MVIKAKQADQERATQEAQVQAACAVTQVTQAAQAVAHMHGLDPVFTQAPSSPMLPPAPRLVYYSAESATDAESVLDWCWTVAPPPHTSSMEAGCVPVCLCGLWLARTTWVYAVLDGGAWQVLQPFVALGERLLQELHMQHMFVVHGIHRAEVTTKLVQRSERTLEVIQAELLAARQKKTWTAGCGGGGSRGGAPLRGSHTRTSLQKTSVLLRVLVTFRENVSFLGKKIFPGRELNPGLPRDRRKY